MLEGSGAVGDVLAGSLAPRLTEEWKVDTGHLGEATEVRMEDRDAWTGLWPTTG